METMQAMRFGLAAAMLAAAACAQAGVTAAEAWVRGTVPAQKSTGGFMTLTSTEDARLVAVSSPAAKRAEIHSSGMSGGVMTMQAVEAIDLPAGKPVQLKPGGFHVMLLGLAAPLKEGAVVPLTLTIEGRDRKRSTLEVQAKVRPLGAR